MSTLDLDLGLIALDAITADDLPVVGGRAARLGQAIRAGLPVPSGAVLTTKTLSCLAGPDAASQAAEYLGRLFESLGRNGQSALTVKMSAVNHTSSADTVEASRGIARRSELFHTIRRFSATATVLGDTVAVIVQHDVAAHRSGRLLTRPEAPRAERRLDDLARSVVDVLGSHRHVEWAIDRADRLWILDIGENV